MNNNNRDNRLFTRVIRKIKSAINPFSDSSDFFSLVVVLIGAALFVGILINASSGTVTP